ncbi:MAG: helix-hairpin-helix domain-containing protein [Thermoplasmata archaeon]
MEGYIEGKIIERNNDGIKELMSVPSVGYLTACTLFDNGYEDISQLEDISAEELESIPAIGSALAQRIYQDLDSGNFGSEGFIKEIKCPECKNIIDSSREACYECGKAFTFDDTGIILPEGEIINKPMEKLCELDKKVMNGEDDEKVWYAKAAIYESMDSFDAAYEAYDKVIEFDPLYDQIWNAKARLATKLGLFDEAARAYKIAVDFRSEGLSHQAVEAGLETEGDERVEEKVQPKKEHDIDVKKVEEEISDARKIVTEFDKDTVGLESLQDELDEAVKSRNKDDRKNAIDKAQSVVNKGIILKELKKILEDIDTKLSVMGEGQDIEVYEDQYHKIRSFAEDGKLKKSLSYAEILIEKLEKIPSDKKLEMKQRFDKKFEVAKEKLGEARETKIDIENIKDLIKDASDLAKDGKYEEGIALTERAEEKLSAVLNIGNKLFDIKELFVEMKDRGMDYSGYKDDILSVKGMAEDGKYEEAEGVIGEAVYMLEKELELAPMEVEESTEEIITGKTQVIVDDFEVESEEEPLDVSGDDSEEEPEDGFEDEFMSRYENMKESYNEIKDSKIDIRPLKKDIKEVIQEKKDKNYRIGLEKIGTIEKEIDTVKEVNRLLLSCAKTVNDIKEEGNEYREYVGELKEIMKQGSEGDYEEIKDRLESLREEVEDIMGEVDEEIESEEELDEVTEEEDLEYEEEVKLEIEEIEEGVVEEKEEQKEEPVSSVSAVDEEEYTMKDVTRKIKKIKNLIVTARNHDIVVEKGGNMINRAMLEAKNGDFSRSTRILDEAREWIRGEMEADIRDKIRTIEEKIERGEEGESRAMAKSFLEEAKKADEEGDLIKVFNLLAKADVKAEEAKSEEEKLMDEIKSMQDMVEQTRKLGIELEDSENMIQKALNKGQEGEIEESWEYLKESKVLAEEIISEDLDSIFKEAQNELKKAKIKGKNVSKAVYLIKKAKEARKEGDLDGCVTHLNDYEEEMKDLE